jgi:hypothetical protein
MVAKNVVAVGGSTNFRASYVDDPANSWSVSALPTLLNGTQRNWISVRYSPDLDQYLATNLDTENNNCGIASSEDDGASWTGRASPTPGSYRMGGAVWCPSLGLWICACFVGNTTTHLIITSPDGITWTGRDVPTASVSLRDVAWSEELGIAVAIGTTNVMFWSTDGVTWNTMTTLPGTSRDWARIVWAGEGVGGGMQKFVAVASSGNGSNNIAYSSDGKNWTQVSTTGTNFADICWSKTRDELMMCGPGPRIAYSTDAASWTVITTTGLGTGAGNGVDWSEDLGEYIIVKSSSEVLTGVPGSWTAQSTEAAAIWNKVTSPPPTGPSFNDLVADFMDGDEYDSADRLTATPIIGFINLSADFTDGATDAMTALMVLNGDLFADFMDADEYDTVFDRLDAVLDLVTNTLEAAFADNVEDELDAIIDIGEPRAPFISITVIPSL